ncbi:MAG: glycosyltransferase family 1 protein [Rhodocyclales bacterium GT-UBC]|nr:MAG: glycosyltransferase family 1 protein [Rhodocyclales bacterium GT-UBC]
MTHSSPAPTDTTWDIVYFPLGAAAFGGAERSLLELAAAQQAEGKRVLIGYERALQDTDFISQAEALDLPLQQVGWSPEDSLLQVARSAWQFFRAIRPALLHFNISWRRRMWLVPVIARIATRARLIGTMRAIPERYDRIPRRFYLGLIPGPRLWILPDLATGRTWARSLDITVSVNRIDFPPRLIKEFGFPESKLRVIYNGVKIPERAPTAEERLVAKIRLGMPADQFLVAYVGRLSEEKGIGHAIEAIAAGPAETQLIVAGEGAILDQLKAQASQLGIARRVHFVGYASQPQAIFTAADVVVVPSLWDEAFGRVVVEAMACGAAVIATAVGGMQEIFTDGQEGLYVPRADSTAIAQAISRLRDDPRYWQDIAQAGRRLVEHKYATQRVVQEYGQLYATLVPARDAAGAP